MIHPCRVSFSTCDSKHQRFALDSFNGRPTGHRCRILDQCSSLGILRPLIFSMLLSLKENSRVANVKNRFLNGVTQNLCLGFLALRQNQVENMTVFTQISTTLEQGPQLVQKSNKCHQEPQLLVPQTHKNQNQKTLILLV